MNNQKQKIIVTCIITFIMGVVLGVSFGRPLMRMIGPPNFEEHMVQRFSKQLNLSSDQQDKVRDLLHNQRDRMHALREEMKPRFEEIKDNTRKEIRENLTPEQQIKFDAMEEKWKEKRMGRHHFPE
jgi:Spy/CpxP family protein refolding chaperone